MSFDLLHTNSWSMFITEQTIDTFAIILTVAGWMLLLSSRHTITIPTIILLLIVALSTAIISGRVGQMCPQWVGSIATFSSASRPAPQETITQVYTANGEPLLVDSTGRLVSASGRSGLSGLGESDGSSESGVMSGIAASLESMSYMLRPKRD